MLELIRHLTQINGTSGDEGEVAAAIKELLPAGSFSTDGLGNVIAQIKGKRTSDKKILLCAHMDEVGFICTGVTDEGYLRIAPVGGIDPRVVMGRALNVNGRRATVGIKAVHQQSAEEKEKAVSFDDMLVDIGAKDKQQALELVSPGDSIYFEGEFTKLGEDVITAKALDDRAGCAVLLKLARDGELPCDVTMLFSVQEEVGLRGAAAAVSKINPDIAIVIEATTAGDIEGVEEHKQVCALGKGAVVGFMDKSSIYDKELYKLAFERAGKKGIPCQTKSMIAGGNDAGIIHKSAGGVRTLAVSIPTRYIHSPSCTANINDIQSVYNLVREMLESL